MLSFILRNIIRLPTDYTERITAFEEVFIKEYNELNAEQCRSVILTGSSAEGLSLDYNLDCATTFPSQDAKMEEPDMDVMMIDNRFIVVESPGTSCHDEPTAPLELELKTMGNIHHGYCKLAIEEAKLQEHMKQIGMHPTSPENVMSCFKKENDENLYLSPGQTI